MQSCHGMYSFHYSNTAYKASDSLVELRAPHDKTVYILIQAISQTPVLAWRYHVS